MILALLEMVSLNSDAKNSPDLTTFVTGNLIDLIRPSSKMLAQSLTFWRRLISKTYINHYSSLRPEFSETSENALLNQFFASFKKMIA